MTDLATPTNRSPAQAVQSRSARSNIEAIRSRSLTGRRSPKGRAIKQVDKLLGRNLSQVCIIHVSKSPFFGVIQVGSDPFSIYPENLIPGTRREAEEIIAAQKTNNAIVQVGYMRRYAPAS